jgi:hypothetical protein
MHARTQTYSRAFLLVNATSATYLLSTPGNFPSNSINKI